MRINKKFHLFVIVILSVIIVSSTVLLINYNPLINRADYLLDKKVPGIVKGTARMVDTEAYFTKYELYESSMRLDLVCNNSNNLEISVGYKSLMEALAIAESPLKEVVIWTGGDAFPKNSFDYKLLQESSTSSLNRITKEWNLLSIGFDEDEYVKADERIWYLRIKDTSGGPYGYEKNVSVEVNGTLYSIPEFIPNIHYIEEFKLVFNKLIFETMLYPFFDGSKEIIVPIRGVNHELAIEDEKTNNEIMGIKASTWSTTTTPYDLGNNYWVIVFGTGDYLWQSGSDDLLFPPMEARSFILGCARPAIPDEYKAGILDYGWRVAYCMDGNSSQTDIATTTQTDDNYLESMFNYADNQLGYFGRLIVFVVGHGRAPYGDHMTITGKSRHWLFTITDVFKLNEYENKVKANTIEGTHVFLWICACHGDGLDSFSYDDHRYCLESWSYRPVHEGAPSNGDAPTRVYTDFCWLYYTIYGTIIAQSECAFFFLGASEGPYEYTVTEIGPVARTYYNNRFGSYMYIQYTWGSHIFYIDWGY